MLPHYFLDSGSPMAEFIADCTQTQKEFADGMAKKISSEQFCDKKVGRSYFRPPGL